MHCRGREQHRDNRNGQQRPHQDAKVGEEAEDLVATWKDLSTFLKVLKQAHWVICLEPDAEMSLALLQDSRFVFIRPDMSDHGQPVLLQAIAQRASHSQAGCLFCLSFSC